MNPNENRNALVIWSGGIDSTVALYNVATQIYNYKKVRVVSFVADLLDEEKLKYEKRYRENFKTAFQLKVEYYELEFKLNGLWGSGQNGCPQAAAWLGMLSPFVEEDTDVIMGYIKDDTVWYFRNELQEIFKLYCAINGYKNSNLIYPLGNDTKKSVINRAKNLGLYRYTWWCENPYSEESIEAQTIANRFHHQYFELADERKFIMCGTCEPCRTHLTPLITEKALSDFHGESDNIAEIKKLRLEE